MVDGHIILLPFFIISTFFLNRLHLGGGVWVLHDIVLYIICCPIFAISSNLFYNLYKSFGVLCFSGKIITHYSVRREKGHG